MEAITILNEFELRVIGSLVEKQISTPDYYPMTLNALINACNQKNHRDPVVSYDEGIVGKALESLREKKLAYVFHGSESRVPKYGHVFPKGYDLNELEVPLVCVLILRGPQTSGELRARTAHLHTYESLSVVEEALQSLASREKPLVVKLPRLSGSRESRFAHLLSGDINLDDLPAMIKTETGHSRSSADNERLKQLETEVASMRLELDSLKAQLESFRKQFE